MATDRPALCEIEIAPEMIEAGVGALCLFRLSEDRPEEIVREVYRSMRMLEGRFSTSVGEAFPYRGGPNLATGNENLANKQALSNERTTEAIGRFIQELERPFRGE